MWHGIGQFSKTWETTPDGREGYQNIFLRRGFGVYLIDQPRRGNAGRSTQPAIIQPTPDEQGWFGTFRLGIWPDFFPGVQFSRDPAALKRCWTGIKSGSERRETGDNQVERERQEAVILWCPGNVGQGRA